MNRNLKNILKIMLRDRSPLMALMNAEPSGKNQVLHNKWDPGEKLWRVQGRCPMSGSRGRYLGRLVVG